MSTGSDRPPPFYCPACGQKHRADLSAIQRTAGAVARVTCARCTAVMGLRIGDDGLPKCEILVEPAKEAAAATPTAAIPGGAMARSSMSLSLLAAAVVAALVSFGVGRLTAADEPAAPAPDTGRLAALEQQLTALRGDLAKARAEARTARDLAQAAGDGVRGVTASVGQGMQANTAKVTAIEKAQSAQGQAFEAVKANYKELNGRIEGNYVKLRSIDKRVKQLEGG